MISCVYILKAFIYTGYTYKELLQGVIFILNMDQPYQLKARLIIYYTLTVLQWVFFCISVFILMVYLM